MLYLPTDINECEMDNICDNNSECLNIEGSFECICRAGFTGNGHIDCDGTQIVMDFLFLQKLAFPFSDIDECAEEESICGDFGTCSNSQGNFSCTCNPGYDLIGRNTCTSMEQWLP